MKKIRVVPDCNVVISALLSPGGAAHAAMRKALCECIVLVSDQTVKEFYRTIKKTKFDRYVPFAERETALIALLGKTTLVESISVLDVARHDPSDNMYVELAVDGHARYIISGNKKHLLVLGSHEGIEIIPPHEFLEIELRW